MKTMNILTTKKIFLALAVSCLMLFNACIVTKKVVYVNDMSPDTAYLALEAPPVKVQNSDRISIVVNAKEAELAVPFNQGLGSFQVGNSGDLNNSASADPGKGYLVSADGTIEFPILGTLRVAGLTLEEIRSMVRNRLIDDKLINEPSVKVELLNLKINMMGEVNDVGVIDVPDGRITLLEAISMAGGLSTNAAADKITVIREEQGVRRMYVNDILSKEVFNSPTYYLRQNDIVYIEPRGARLSDREENNWRYISTGLGLLATVFTILNFLK